MTTATTRHGATKIQSTDLAADAPTHLGAMADTFDSAIWRYRGAYAAGTAYVLNDLVTDAGGVYLHIAAASTGSTPASTPTTWLDLTDTAARLLAKLLTVDGAGSALDADLLDGQHASALLDRANHTGAQAIGTVTGLQAALDAKAPLASPALTGTPTAPTATAGTNTTQIASTAFVQAALAAAGGAIALEDDGVQVLAAATRINFVGATVADAGSGEATVTIDASAAADATYVRRDTFPVTFGSQLSSMTAAATASTTVPVAVLYAPYAFTLSGLMASLATADTATGTIVDIHMDGTSILSGTPTSKLTIDANEATSETATNPVVIVTNAIPKGAKLEFFIDQVGTVARGLQLWLLGTRNLDVATVPAQVTGLAATRGDAQVVLNWDALAPTPSGYRVERSPDGSTGWTEIATPTANTYTNTGLSNGTQYFYRVRAYNGAGNGTYSTTVNATPATTPGTPTGLTVTNPTGTTLDLSWTAPASNGGTVLTDYVIQRATDAAFTANLTTLTDGTGTGTTYTDTGLTPSTTYYYRVAAVNAVGQGSYTAGASGTTAAGATPSVVHFEQADGSPAAAGFAVVPSITALGTKGVQAGDQVIVTYAAAISVGTLSDQYVLADANWTIVGQTDDGSSNQSVHYVTIRRAVTADDITADSISLSSLFDVPPEGESGAGTIHVLVVRNGVTFQATFTSKAAYSASATTISVTPAAAGDIVYTQFDAAVTGVTTPAGMTTTIDGVARPARAAPSGMTSHVAIQEPRLGTAIDWTYTTQDFPPDHYGGAMVLSINN